MGKRMHLSKLPTRISGLALLITLAVSACGDSTASAPALGIPGHDNPLMAVWETDFGVPPFDLIQDDDYLPAFREAMDMHKAEIEVDRKVLADIAVHDPEGFGAIAEAAKAGLEQQSAS